MENPKLQVETKYGHLTLVFLDPDGFKKDSRGNPTHLNEQYVASLHGELTIRGIVVLISTRLAYGLSYYQDGARLEEPVREFGQVSTTAYHRREDTKGPLTDTQRHILFKLIEGPVREAYEAHPELQHAARRARLVNEQEVALATVAEARDNFIRAVWVYETARDDLELFDAADALERAKNREA